MGPAGCVVHACLPACWPCSSFFDVELRCPNRMQVVKWPKAVHCPRNPNVGPKRLIGATSSVWFGRRSREGGRYVSCACGRGTDRAWRAVRLVRAEKRKTSRVGTGTKRRGKRRFRPTSDNNSYACTVVQHGASCRQATTTSFHIIIHHK